MNCFVLHIFLEANHIVNHFQKSISKSGWCFLPSLEMPVFLEPLKTPITYRNHMDSIFCHRQRIIVTSSTIVSPLRVTPTNPSKFGPLLPQIRIPHPDFSSHFSLLSNRTLFSGSLFSLTYILYITCNYQVQHFISKPCSYYWNGYLLMTILYG